MPQRGIRRSDMYAGVLGSFQKFLCRACNKTLERWLAHFEPARPVLCPCRKPALPVKEVSCT
jgi:hypothetical protein